MKKSLVFVLLLFTAIFPLSGDDNAIQDTAPSLELPALDIESLRRAITGEDRSELISLELGDNSVSLDLSGSWKGTLGLGWGIAFTPLGNSALAGDTPLFMQEADLTLSLWIRDRWFVEGSFLDDYSLNTYRAGYQGALGEIIQYAGIGNTGLDFPAFPYLDLGNASPSSFGFYSRFEGADLSVHSLVRYDSAVREEKIFTNGRERTYMYLDLTRPVRGISFVLPDSGLNTIPVVYIEDPNGTLTGDDGRHWRQAEPSEYAASAQNGLLELSLGIYTGGSVEPEGMIAVAYSLNGDPAPWNNSLGKYSESPSGDPARDFLGRVQAYFDRSERGIALEDYPQCGGAFPAAAAFTQGDGPGQTAINGIPVLVIYEKGTFSPFEQQNQYRLSAGGTAALVRLSTGTVVPGYELLPNQENTAGLFKLIRGIVSQGRRDEKDRWPLVIDENIPSDTGLIMPELYVPGRQVYTGDLGIRTSSYTAVDSYHIGTDVVPGSVQVFRDGLLDPDFIYNPASGTVSLGKAPFFNEIIRVSYLKRSAELHGGSIAAGVGAVWNRGTHFTSKLGIGLRWNLSGNAYSEEDVSGPGSAGLGAEARWNYDRFQAGLTLGLGFEQPDTSGLYRAAGMEGNEVLINLTPEDSFISPEPSDSTIYDISRRAPLIYRNYRETSIWGTSSLNDIESSGQIVSGQNGPYPAMDSTFVPGSRVQILAAEFSLNPEQYWTGFQIPLGQSSALLERAKELQLPFRFYGLNGAAAKIIVRLQAGSLADRNSTLGENPNLVIEKILYPPADPENQGTINLSDEDRRKLTGADFLRVIITTVPEDPLLPGETISGRFILAPPIIKGAGFRPIIAKDNGLYPAPDSVSSNGNAAVLETIETGTNRLEDQYSEIIQRLHQDGKANRILKLAWDELEPGIGAGADSRINILPLMNYHKLSFFIRRPEASLASEQSVLDSGSFRFIIGQGPQSFNNPRETVLDAVIPLSAFDTGRTWAKVELKYQGPDLGIYIDGTRIPSSPGSSITYNTEFSGSGSTWLAVLVTPGSSQLSPVLPAAGMALDEIILEESIASYRLNAGANLDWNLPGAILSAGDFPVFEDFVFSAAMESGASGNPLEKDSAGSLGMNARTRTEATVLGIRVTGTYSMALNSSPGNSRANYTWRAGHSLSRDWTWFSLRESFDHAPFDNTLEHEVSAAINSPVRFSLSGNLAYRDDRYNRKWQGSLGGAIPSLPLELSAGAGADWIEKAARPQGMDNYAEAWVRSWEPWLPNPGNGALKREGRAYFTSNLGTLPLGFRFHTEGTSSFSGTDNAVLSGIAARMDFPLTLEINSGIYRFLFRGEREFRRNLYFGGTGFHDDLGQFGKALGDSVPLMLSIPLYSFFDPALEEKIRNANFHSYLGPPVNSGYFSEGFDFSLQTPENYAVSALFIPSRITLRINRVLDQKMDVFRDTINYSASLNFSAVNLFGVLGASPLFSFYASDQFSHSLEAAVSIPRNEKISFRIQSAQDLNFNGFEGGELNLAHILTVSSSNFINNESRWTDTVNLTWVYPVEKSFLGMAYSAIMSAVEKQSSWLVLAELSRAEYELLQRERLDFAYEYVPGASAADSRFSLTLGHESLVRILGRLNLSVFASLKITNDFDARILSFLANIGISLGVTF